MSINDEIVAFIRAAKFWDPDAKLEDFQIRVAEGGYILVNLKTGRTRLIYDKYSKLHDLQQLLPEVCFAEFGCEKER